MSDRLDGRPGAGPGGEDLIVYAIRRIIGDLWRDAFLVQRWVVRRGQTFRDHDFTVVRPTLRLARKQIPPECDCRLPPDPDDDSTLVETWM